MDSYVENSALKQTQGLCKKCGRCCRVVANNNYSYAQLKNMAADGNEYAQDFVNLFIPYSSIAEARAVDAEAVDNIINHLKADKLYNEQDLTFYKCRYIMDNNLCSIYEERPALCIHCPSSGWVVTPPGCGYESWLFMKREEDMQRVRRAKEELLDLKVMKKKTQDEELIRKIESVEKKICKTIEMYSRHGSAHW